MNEFFNFFFTLNCRESQTDAFGRFVQSFDGAVRMMQQNFAEHVKRHQGPYKRDFQRIGLSFRY